MSKQDKHQQTEPLARDMTLHDWYAGMALQGLLAGNPEAYEDAAWYAVAMMEARAKRMEGEQ